MPSFEAAAKTIWETFNLGFTSHEIAWGNQAFQPPKDGNGDPKAYVEMRVQQGEAVPIAWGTDGAANPALVHRHPGVVKIRIFVPLGQGEAPALKIADDVSSVFRAKNISGVRFSSPTVSSDGIPRENPAYWQATVTCPFIFDLTETLA